MTTKLEVRLSDDSRTVREWGHAGPHGAWANARRYAREHGAAGVLREADLSYVLLYRDGATMRRKTWKSVRVISECAR